MMSPPMLILASASPRRRQLLTEAGYEFRVIEPHDAVECGLCSEESPSGIVAELAFRKAADVVRRLAARQDHPPGTDVLVLAADTVAECDGLVLGKPTSEADARRMLQSLSGRKHRVLSGVCIWPLGRAEPDVRVAVTELRMDPLTDQQIETYLAGGQWEGKAGAFGYQDRLTWVHIVEGSASNVVGLPLELVAGMLAEARRVQEMERDGHESD